MRQPTISKEFCLGAFLNYPFGNGGNIVPAILDVLLSPRYTLTPTTGYWVVYVFIFLNRFLKFRGILIDSPDKTTEEGFILDGRFVNA